MTPWVLVESSRTPQGVSLELCRRGDEFMIRADGQSLMGSWRSGSEKALAELAIAAAPERPAPRVLVAGLGCGYTLRAALDRLPSAAQVTVVELVPAVVAWNRGLLARLAERPLDDRRVTVAETNVVTLMKTRAGKFDIVLLDVDNGPQALTDEGNAWLYTKAGLRSISKALSARGVLAVWSAGPDRDFEERFEASRFEVARHRVAAADTGKGSRHLVWVGKRRATD